MTNIKKFGIFSLATLASAGSMLAQSSDSGDQGVSVAATIGGGIGGLFGLLIGVIVIVGMWKIFVKAGQPGWASIIPFYNIYILCQITAKPIWWFLLLVFCPPIAFILAILLTVALAKSFGKGVGFAIGMVLLPFVFYPILGFGDATYTAPEPQS